jgi:hypothetical protein
MSMSRLSTPPDEVDRQALSHRGTTITPHVLLATVRKIASPTLPWKQHPMFKCYFVEEIHVFHIALETDTNV